MFRSAGAVWVGAVYLETGGPWKVEMTRGVSFRTRRPVHYRAMQKRIGPSAQPFDLAAESITLGSVSRSGETPERGRGGDACDWTYLHKNVSSTTVQ